MYYYLVIKEFEELQTVMATYFDKAKITTVYLNKEFGKSGDNPHYNYVVESSHTNTKALRNAIVYAVKQCVGAKKLSVKACDDNRPKFYKYLSKENNFQELYNIYFSEADKENAIALEKKYHTEKRKKTATYTQTVVDSYIPVINKRPPSEKLHHVVKHIRSCYKISKKPFNYKGYIQNIAYLILEIYYPDLADNVARHHTNNLEIAQGIYTDLEDYVDARAPYDNDDSAHIPCCHDNFVDLS